MHASLASDVGVLAHATAKKVDILLFPRGRECISIHHKTSVRDTRFAPMFYAFLFAIMDRMFDLLD